MTRNRTHAFSLAAALIFCGILLASFAPQAGAQGSQPTAPQTQKIVKTHFVVVQMSYQSLQVRGLGNVRDLHTFSYSPGIRDKMQNVYNAGGYKYGDKVAIWYRQGTTVALNIKGKPSKKK